VHGLREAQLDHTADLLAAHLDLDAVLGLLDGAPAPAPVISSVWRPIP
jgi:adenosylcobyric acid synthase